MGAVYLGTDRRDRTMVAIKVLHPDLTEDESFRERFEREAHVGALLRSPYTVHILDYGIDKNQYFIVMDYVDGQTLKEVMRSGPLMLRRSLRIAVQIARALEEAQARGVIHRDIKPENIMLAGNDSVKVTDFGIARQVGSGTLTMPGAFVGTLAYAAPEQFSGSVDHRSDIYSLGATLYHMLAGRPPFTGSFEEMLRAVRESPADLQLLADLPPGVVEIVARCLNKDPDKRYQSASALAAALQDPGGSETTQTYETAAAAQEAAMEQAARHATPPARSAATAPGPKALPSSPGIVHEPPSPAPAAAASRSRLPWRIGIAGGLGLAAVVIAAIVLLFLLDASGGGDGSAQSRLSINFWSGDGEISSIGSDGSGSARLVEGAEGGLNAAFTGTGRLAFLARGPTDAGIYVMNSDGSGRVQLTRVPRDNEVALFWSPEGNRIAFLSQSPTEGVTDLSVLNVNSPGLTRLSEHRGGDLCLGWSPDGARVGFSAVGAGGKADVYVVSPDGSGLANLTNDALDNYDPVWSPDGTRIAFVTDPSSTGGDVAFDLYVMNPDGSGVTNLTNNPANDFDARWSPDGARIAFVSAGTESGQDIYVMNADGSGRQKLTNDGTSGAPSWSPDGTRITFISGESGATDVYVMNADGSGLINLTNNPADYRSPAWSIE
jgi:serine/threonine-protein kinase